MLKSTLLNFKLLNWNKKKIYINIRWIDLYATLHFNYQRDFGSMYVRTKFLVKPRSVLKVQPSVTSLRPVSNKPKKIRVDNQLLWQLFRSLYQTLLNQHLPYFRPQGIFKAFFFYNNRGGAVCLNYLKLYKRWIVTYKLLLNIFFKQLEPFIFTTKIFRNEAIAFNWNSRAWEYTLFKRVSPYFFLQDTVYGNSTNLVFHSLSEKYQLLSFVTNSDYHEKNLKFLKKFNAYTIGVTPLNAHPWIVSYPILTGTNELVTEYYFLSLLSFLKQFSQTLYYQELLSLWATI